MMSEFVRRHRTSRAWSAALKPALAASEAAKHAKLMSEIAELGLVVTSHSRDATSVAYWQQGDRASLD